MKKGGTFEAAILASATDCSGLATENAHHAVANPDFLIADGLDECDPNRQEISQQLKSWCDGHPQCHVVVTTRPVGHDAGLLLGFRHLEILPLDTVSIRQHAFRLIEAAIDDPSKRLQALANFATALDSEERQKRRSVKTLAARNPLLLGFLVRLALDGVSAGGNRSELFSQILDLMRTAPTEREYPDVDKDVDSLAIEAIGWALLHSPAASADSVAEMIGQALTNASVAGDVRAKAVDALNFWEGCRAVERLTAGHLDAIVFVHPMIGEFAAAKYAQRLNDGEFLAWVRRVRRQPQWHQVVLLAAGIDRNDRLLRILIDLDDPLDPTSTESALAAEAITEDSSRPSETSARVSDALVSRLTSPVPLISIESTLSLLPIASFASEFIGEASAGLLDHPQE